MKCTLNIQNISDYLIERGFNSKKEFSIIKAKKILGKNFNFLLDFQNRESIFIKQEYQDTKGKVFGEFLNELQVYELTQRFPDLKSIKPFFPEYLHFDRENSVLILKYQKDYQDLGKFYIEKNIFPATIAASLGKNLGELHQKTSREKFKDFLSQNKKQSSQIEFFKIVRDLDKVSPEIFGTVTEEGLKFFSLYQRCSSLKEAIAELLYAYASKSHCLIHGDLKFNNVLLHIDWKEKEAYLERNGKSLVKLIDWERSTWGNPAFDLGTVIAGYLQMWLQSLVVNKSIDIKTSIDLATTPLASVHSSTTTFVRTYLSYFPEIQRYYPDLISQVVQYAGLSLIIYIISMLEQKVPFDNKGICMLQVAKTLLCSPKQSIPTIFGMTESKLLDYH